MTYDAPCQPMRNPYVTLPSAGQYVPALLPGTNVVVTHPANRLRYHAQVVSTLSQLALVQFANGAQQWVPAGAVQRA